MGRDKIENFVNNLIEVIWEKHEVAKLSQFYHPDLEGYYNDDSVNFDQLEKKLQVFHEHMKYMEVKIIDLIIENNSFALHAVQKLKREAREISIHSILIAHLKEDKIYKYWLKTEMPLEFN